MVLEPTQLSNFPLIPKIQTSFPLIPNIQTSFPPTKLQPDLLLDIYLHDYVSNLYAKIRERALIQYFTPYKSVDLKPMAEAFGTTIKDLEIELGNLILSGSISARIDSHNQRLYAREIDQRSTTFQRVVSTGNEFQDHTQSMLLRMNMMRNDFFVKNPKREEKDRKGKKEEK